jgi:GMP synthase-like glutamine amidotransferase
MSREDGSHRARVLAIVHHADAGPGVFAEAIAQAGAELDEWLIPEGSPPPRDPREYTAVVALGSAAHVDQAEEHPWLAEERELLSELVQADVPVLGVCFGAELLAQAGGGDAVRAPRPEVGWFEVEVDPAGAGDPVLGPLAPRFEAFGWHSYEVILPEHASLLASSEACIQAFRVGDRAWGIQFHSEVTHRDLLRWIDESRSDPDADGLDTEALRAQTELSIERWNDLGREMAGRFLAEATRLSR